MLKGVRFKRVAIKYSLGFLEYVHYISQTTSMYTNMSGSCHLDRASNDEFSVQCVLIFSADMKIRSESSTNP